MKSASSNKIAELFCPICGINEKSLIVALGRDLSFGNAGSFEILSCNGCGVMYLTPRLNIDEVRKYYRAEGKPNVYEMNPRWKRYLDGWRFKRRMECIEREILQYAEGGNLLDVGCGRGEFLYGMSKCKRWKLQGLEMEPEAANFVEKEFGIPVYIGTLEKALPEDICFDVITLWDVFEHLRDPVLALQKLKGALKENGLLAIKMPNPDSFGTKLFGRYWYGWSIPQHYFTWSPKVFKQFVENQGLKVAGTKYLYGAYSDYLTSIGFAFDGLAPRKVIKIALRVLSEEPFQMIASCLTRAEVAMGRPSSITYFISRP